MQILTYLIYFLTVMAIGYVYKRYQSMNERKKMNDEYELVKEFLLQDDTKLDENVNKICWVHIPYEVNSRKWLDFYSRNSSYLNKPYVYLCIKSIIEQNASNMKVCIIDDESFAKLIPSWKIDLNSVPEPSKEQVRKLGIAQLLYYYGGVHLPYSFVCMKNVMPLLNSGRDMFSVETRDRSINSSVSELMPDDSFIGCERHSQNMKEYIQYLERNISTDQSSESVFMNNNRRILLEMANKDKLSLLGGAYVGQKTSNNELIRLDDLLQKDYISFHDELFGIYIDDKELEKRTHYNWFMYLTKDEIIQSDVILAKYLSASAYYSM